MARNALTRLGAFLVLFGVGSLILPMFNMQFRLLMWADTAQPFLGIALTLAGAAMIIVPFVMKPKAPEQAAAPAYGPALTDGTPAQFGQPGQFGQPAPYGVAPPTQGTQPHS